MDNWTEREEGTVKIVHHSTSSCIEIIMDEGDDPESHYWFDYYQWSDLLKAIEKTNP